jgi:predicted nucleotidyltransferase component of viral defense system
MIDKRELLEKAGELSLKPKVIEKDYVLGWLLAGISNHKDLKDKWLFKGGTCLKKCFFETYRFSEDLDFTLLDPTHLNEEFLKKTFSEIAEWVYNNSGIDVAADRKFSPIKIEIYKNLRDNDSCKGNIYYRGPMTVGQGGSAPTIKLDLTVDEKVVLEPVRMQIDHIYSDKDKKLFSALCYHYIDLFAEKTRALDERKRPGARDLYDVVNMYRHGIEVDLEKLNTSIKEKCGFKGIAVPSMTTLDPKQEEFRVQWDSQLKHQLQILPPFESYWSELPIFFNWLAGHLNKKPLPVLKIGKDEGSRNSIFESRLKVVQNIRFAAASHLCINLDYRNEKGEHKQYLLEPYSFRTTSENKILLYTIHEGKPRAFRIDRMIGATVTSNVFVPKYEIEIVEDGGINAPKISIRPVAFSSRSYLGRKRK